MTIERRFALITIDGGVLYPYKKSQTATGRHGFAATTPEHGRDRGGGGYYTESIEEVIDGVLFRGWGVRAKEDGVGAGLRNGSYKLGERAVGGYWLALELRHLAQGAAQAPEHQLPDSALPTPEAEDRPDLEAIKRLTLSDYVEAFRQVGAKLTEPQRWMLIGHASEPGGNLSMNRIAQLGGFKNRQTANVQYGKIGHRLADAMGLPAQRYWTNVLCIDGGRDDRGEWQWAIREEVIEALEQLGWLEREDDALPGFHDAEREITEDPTTRALPETNRLALINARIGQGGYRKRMLNLWAGRCAVTGCPIEAVLVASHAKPWRSSTNAERLDEFNGLLLSASVDRLFDTGLIAFAEDGRMLISPLLTAAHLAPLGLPADARLRGVNERHRPYLAAHRKTHGFA